MVYALFIRPVMKLTKTFLSFALVILIISSCKKTSNETQCHPKFTIRNNSADTVIIANENGTTTFFCNLRGEKCGPSKDYEFTAYSGCWEKELDTNRVMEIYIVDPSHFNVDTCYTHDKIGTFNTVLKHYTLGITELKNGGFAFTYP